MDPTTESAALLSSGNDGYGAAERAVGSVKDVDPVFQRFADRQKILILAIVSSTGLLSLFTLTCFVPMIPAITKDLNTTAEMVDISIAVYLIALSFGSLFWARYADFYGRRPVYLISLGIYSIGSATVCICQDVWQLVAARALQAFGVCSFLSVGSGTVADIYEPAKRGFALGIYCGLTVVAPATAPLVGGFVAQYFSWRWLQAGLAVVGLAFELLIYAMLPETSHPGSRGLDKLDFRSTFWDKVVFLNPLRPLTILLRPNIAMMCAFLGIVLIPEYVLLVPMPYILEESFGITDGVKIGGVCMSMGLGSMLGAPFAGYISDRTVVKYQTKRGKRIPEDRLRAAWVGVTLMLPISLVLFGVSADYIRGPLGLTICIICLFVCGVAIDLAFTPGLTYVADSLIERKVEGLAANAATRLVFLSIATSGVLPLVKSVGNLWTALIVTFFIGIACILLRTLIRCGRS